MGILALWQHDSPRFVKPELVPSHISFRVIITLPRPPRKPPDEKGNRTRTGNIMAFSRSSRGDPSPRSGLEPFDACKWNYGAAGGPIRFHDTSSPSLFSAMTCILASNFGLQTLVTIRYSVGVMETPSDGNMWTSSNFGWRGGHWQKPEIELYTYCVPRIDFVKWNLGDFGLLV